MDIINAIREANAKGITIVFNTPPAQVNEKICLKAIRGRYRADKHVSKLEVTLAMYPERVLALYIENACENVEHYEKIGLAKDLLKRE